LSISRIEHIQEYFHQQNEALEYDLHSKSGNYHVIGNTGLVWGVTTETAIVIATGTMKPYFRKCSMTPMSKVAISVEGLP
jgi:hypothetical protein